jgi:hypothetical protein
MSVERIIQESINKNPTAMKAALEEELKNRIRLALEASDEEMDDEDDGEGLNEDRKEKYAGVSYAASYDHHEKYRYFSQEAKKTKDPSYKKAADAHKKAMDAYDKVQAAASNEKTTDAQVTKLYDKAEDLTVMADRLSKGLM